MGFGKEESLQVLVVVDFDGGNFMLEFTFPVWESQICFMDGVGHFEFDFIFLDHFEGWLWFSLSGIVDLFFHVFLFLRNFKLTQNEFAQGGSDFFLGWSDPAPSVRGVVIFFVGKFNDISISHD